MMLDNTFQLLSRLFRMNTTGHEYVNKEKTTETFQYTKSVIWTGLKGLIKTSIYNNIAKLTFRFPDISAKDSIKHRSQLRPTRNLHS